MHQQPTQRCQILTIVIGHPAQVARGSAAQITEPCGGGFAAGEVVFADDAQHLAFDGGEAAVLPAAFVASTRGIQQVDVVEARQRVVHARETEAGGEQRGVVAFAVVAGEHGVGAQGVSEGGEQVAFGAECGHQPLAEMQRVVAPLCDADHEGAGAGAACEAGGFGVEEQDVVGGNHRDATVECAAQVLRQRVAAQRGVDQAQAGCDFVAGQGAVGIGDGVREARGCAYAQQAAEVFDGVRC